MSEKKTFFISRAGPDKRWAELIASVVRDAGHEPFFEDEHFRPGQNIVTNMSRGAEANCTIALYSPAYFQSDYCVKELNAALFKDPLGHDGTLIPILVAPVELPSFVADIAYLDLVGIDDDTARKRVLSTLQKHGQIARSMLKLQGRTRRVIDQAGRNRAAMLQKVRATWVNGILKKSLFQEVRILLGLSERPDSVASPFHLLVKRPDEGAAPLAAGTEVVDVYESMGEALLILGAPGSGKTTLLLELAANLLDRADYDATHPIPVVFPLSTWAKSRMALADWLKEQLYLLYNVPRAIANRWVKDNQVLPLLDGLDEVHPEYRVVCVQAINAFRQARGLLPIVVTSREADYEALSESLLLQGAILVQPLSYEQVSDYLIRLGSTTAVVRSALDEDHSLWDLLDSPLLLNVMILSYVGRSAAALPVDGSLHDSTSWPLGADLIGASEGNRAIPRDFQPEPQSKDKSGRNVKRRDQLFGLYFSEMLRRRAVEVRYTRERTVEWLAWLAAQMYEKGETVVYVDQIDLGWLSETQRWATLAWGTLVFSVIGGMAGGLALETALGLFWSTSAEFFAGLVGGLASGLYTGSSGAVFVERISGGRLKFNRCEGVTKAARTGCIISLQVGLVIGLIEAQSQGAMCGLIYGFVFCHFSWLLCVVAVLLIHGMAERPDLAEVVTRRMNRNSAVITGLIALVVGLVGVRAVGMASGIVNGLVGGAIAGSVCARLGVILTSQARISGYLARLVLVRNGSAPWNYVRFLDYAADRILLRKVGGGYMFIHRMLLEWFAARYVEQGTSHGNELRPESP